MHLRVCSHTLIDYKHVCAAADGICCVQEDSQRVGEFLAFVVPHEAVQSDRSPFEINAWMQAQVQLATGFDCLRGSVGHVAWASEQRQQPVRL